MRAARWILLWGTATIGACAFPQTRLEPAADYGAAPRASYSAAPAYTAGPSEVLTASPDGATRFVCADGSNVPASQVPPGRKPAC
jgi:hypothetical protein